MAKAEKKPITMIRIKRTTINFEHKYGRGELRKLLELLSTDATLATIAARFGVSDERVRQWRDVFGTHSVVVTFVPSPWLADRVDLGKGAGTGLTVYQRGEIEASEEGG